MPQKQQNKLNNTIAFRVTLKWKKYDGILMR